MAGYAWGEALESTAAGAAGAALLQVELLLEEPHASVNSQFEGTSRLDV